MLDLTEFCSDWNIEYELWQLVPEPQQVSSLSLPMNQQDVQIVLHNWLGSASPNEMHIPLAISPNVRSFSVVHTVFSWILKQHSISYELRSGSIPETLRPAHNYQHWSPGTFCPYYCKVDFSLNGQYVALVETSNGSLLYDPCGEQRISVYEINASAALSVLNMELIGNLTINHGAERVKEILFHPYGDIMAIKINSIKKDRYSGWETYIHLWNFRQEFPESITSYSIGNGWHFAFSSCGGYLKAQFGLTIPIPSIVAQERCNLHLSPTEYTFTLRQLSQPENQSRSLINSNTQVRVPHNVPQQETTSVSLRGSDVILSDKRTSSHQNVNLVTLPDSIDFSQTKQSVRLRLPQGPREPIGISIDIEPQDVQILSFSISAPLYVERDPRMVLVRNRGNMIEAPRFPLFDVSYGQVGMKRIMEDFESDTSDHPKRRRYIQPIDE
ncbi:hypothetical protein GGR53DRAFT_401023 [Hypoxylon sp. FL1150]|nr:hypothetical protein GGR53DRAFT_401023 [Hypoxylon sp. FL1150]